MPERQVRIDLVAQDKASRVVEDVADEVRDLEKLDPEVEITADADQAERALEDVSDEAKELARRTTEIVLTGKVDAARGALRDAQQELDKVTGKAKETRQAVDSIGDAHPRVGGNIAADVTGPLGEASGAASDLGGVFDGLGDLTEAAFSRMGQAAVGAGVASALGGIGLAVAGVAAAWSYFSGQAKKAKEAQEKLVDGQEELNDAVKEGDKLRFATRLIEDYGDAYDAGKKLGVSVEEVTQFITGQADELPTLEAAWIDAKNTVRTESEYMASGARNANRDAAAAWLEQYDAIGATRQRYIDAKGTWQDSKTLLGEVANATGIVADETDDLAGAADNAKRKTDNLKTAMDKLKGSLSFERAVHQFNQTFDKAMGEAQTEAGVSYDAILDMKDAIFEVAEFAGLTPVEVDTLLDEVEQGDLASVKEKVNGYYRQNPAGIDTTITEPTAAEANAAIARLRQRLNVAWLNSGGRGTAPIYGPSMVNPGPPVDGGGGGGVVNVTQYVPRGYRGDVLGDARAAARRHGGLYQRSRR